MQARACALLRRLHVQPAAHQLASCRRAQAPPPFAHASAALRVCAATRPPVRQLRRAGGGMGTFHARAARAGAGAGDRAPASLHALHCTPAAAARRPWRLLTPRPRCRLPAALRRGRPHALCTASLAPAHRRWRPSCTRMAAGGRWARTTWRRATACAGATWQRTTTTEGARAGLGGGSRRALRSCSEGLPGVSGARVQLVNSLTMRRSCKRQDNPVLPCQLRTPAMHALAMTGAHTHAAEARAKHTLTGHTTQPRYSALAAQS